MCAAEGTTDVNGDPAQVLEGLTSPDEDVRRASLHAAAGQSDLRLLPDLKRIEATDDCVELRVLARQAILQIAGVAGDGDARARAGAAAARGVRVPPLDDPDPENRSRAIRARAARGREDDMAALEARVECEEDPTVRCTLALALGASGSKSQIPALERLVEDPDAIVRAHGLEGMGLLRDPAAYPYFVRHARDLDNRLRTFAIKALGKLGKETVLRLCEAMCRSTKPWMVESGLHFLAGARDPRHLALFQQLSTYESDVVRAKAREGIERLAAAGHAGARQALGGLPAPPGGGPGSGPALAAAAAGAVVVPAPLPPGPGRQELRSRRIPLPDLGPDALRDADPALRVGHIQMVVSRKDREAVPGLLGRLERERDPRVLASLVGAIGVLGESSAVDYLVDHLDSADDRLRANAVEAIGRLARPENRRMLVRFLDDPHHRVRTNAILALWGLGFKGVREELAKLKESADRRVRFAALYAIQQIGEPASGMLHGLLVDPDPDVAARARACWQALGLGDPAAESAPSGDAAADAHGAPPGSVTLVEGLSVGAAGAGASPPGGPRSAAAAGAPGAGGAVPPAAGDAEKLRTRLKDLESLREQAFRQLADAYMERVGKGLVAPPEIFALMGDVTAARGKLRYGKPETRAALVAKQEVLARAIVSREAWPDDEGQRLARALADADSELASASARLSGMEQALSRPRRIRLLVALAVLLMAIGASAYFALAR
jgi:HEAT repeat protein